jgi:hypothetical protein
VQVRLVFVLLDFAGLILILLIDEQANFDPDDVTSHPTDTNEEVEPWDNDPDGDDDPDAAWEIDEDETESNQSSVTLSSKMSSKRSISEVEQEQKHDHTPSFPASPGSSATFLHCLLPIPSLSCRG